MANGLQNQEGVPENLKRQLAVAVRSVQWSYAIFWSLSTRQQGVLEWCDGYYNGDIKIRKAFQAVEIKIDRTGLQRSEQLRELYECLLDGETDQEAERPAAALSPDDLTDAEWYYLVCMSFVFNPGQGLPGRALANNQPIWLCDAQCADSKVFSRSLLAKSASVQTVICFPHLGGVIELGVTELVLEDPSLIQHIKASLLEFSKPVCSEKSSSAPHERDNDTDCMYAKVDHETANKMALENYHSPAECFGLDQDREANLQDDFTVDSPDDCSNGCEHNHQTGDSFLVEASNGGASQAQSLHFMDDDFSNCVQDSINSSDCISQAFVNQEKALSPPKGENMSSSHLKETQESNHTKLTTLDLGIKDDDLHYRRTLSAVLRYSHRVLDNHFLSCHYKSSFVSWKKGERVTGHGPQVQQEMLKKILFSVPLVQAFPDKRIKDENEKFMVLKSMVPSISKIDKESILGGTIEYLKELKARIEDLESSVYSAGHEANRRKYADVIERSSDNYENGRIESRKKPWINKRKASDIDEIEPEISSVVPKDGPQLDMQVKIKQQEVRIAMRCPWRKHLTLHIIDAMNNLNLEPQSIQSSIVDSILTATIELKFRGAAVASATTIKQALSAIAGNR